MSAVLQTSSSFASAVASGADWRDVGRKILESLESIRTEKDGMNVGFLYATQELAEDLPSLLALLKNVTRIAHWFGATGQGICGCGQSCADLPAASAMIGALPEGSFHGFTLSGELPEDLTKWMREHVPSAALMHGVLCAQSASRLRHMREHDGIYTIGGFAAGAHISAGAIVQNDPLSGLVFDANIRIMSATSFGCEAAGAAGRITKCSGSIIETIDDRPACAMLHEAINSLKLEGEARAGHVHAAFPVAGSDQHTFLVRNITQADEDSGHICVAHNFERGDLIRFVYRDEMTAASDLSHVLTGLYARASDEMGATNLKPKAILYFGCGARLAESGMDGKIPESRDEAALIKRIFGDVPMAGFYTAAEICNGHVFGYTGVLVLFL